MPTDTRVAWIPAQGVRFALLLVATILAVGTAGYVLIEGWGPWDAFYMTVTTVTTVGFREVHELSRAGQVFTVVLIVTGVGTAFYAATLIAAALVEGGVHRRIAQRRFARMLHDIRDHFIVCGYGRIGRIITEDLHRQGIPFVVIERDPELVETVIKRGWLAVHADASQEDALRGVGIERARGLIAAVGTDAENVYTVLTARVMRPDLFIVARVESDDAEKRLMRAGANRVISPYRIGASHIVQSAVRPAVVDFVQLATTSGHLDLSMEQVHITPASSLVSRSLLDAGIRQKFGVIVIAIKREDGTMDFNPSPEAMIRGGDELVVLGRPQSVKALEESVAK